MARKYTTQEVKKLIDKHNENIKNLENSCLLPSKLKSQIQSCVINLYYARVFSNDVMNSLNGIESSQKKQIADLIRLLYLFKRANRQAYICQTILSNNKNRIASIVKEASTGSNSFIWFFSSSKKKQLSENAYEKLLKESDGSEYWTTSQNILSQIAANDKVAATEGWKDFEDNVDEYQDILKKSLSINSISTSLIKDLQKLVDNFEGIASKLEKETSKTNDIKDKIKTAAERMTMATVLDILKTIPVDEVNRNKKGVRVKALRDAGYATIADVYAASPFQLASIYGISEDTAYTIKNIAKEFAVETRRTTKIKLSVDNKTKEATNLVDAIYKYKQYIDALESLNKFNSDYSRDVKGAISNIQSVGNGIYWTFFKNNKKETIKKSFSFLSREINGDYKNRADQIVEMFKKADAPTTGNAWNDFKTNPISYFNIIEDIVPGVLGNDDKLYGLPEDLAREIQEECFFPDGLNCELRRYQEWGVKYILHQERVLLGDEMGLGKTVQAIATMVSLRNTGASHFIVVCPASVLLNWCKEIALKSKLRVTKVHGADKLSAIKSWIQTGGVAVTTYETTGIFQFDDAFKYDLLVVDEAHFIKNTDAVRSQNVRKLSTYTKRLLFMTGTALENNVQEMISLIDVLQPKVADNIRNITFMSTAPQFREKIAGVYYRRKREDVITELPELTVSKEWCIMSAKETQLYEQEVLAKNFMGARRLSWNVDNLNDSCKARRMLEIINEAESEGRKVLIFSFFLDTIRKIYAYLGDRCCNPINGSLKPQRRQEIIDQFNDDSQKTVLCAQIQSGGTGLNIQAASVVIICEPQFKPSIENQAISRAYRMGQVRNVLVYRLLCEETVDEKITQLLDEKQAIFDAFADKSVAAANAERGEKEIDETTFGKIIEEEIERIKEKGGIAASVPKDVSMLKVSEPKKKNQQQEKIANELDFKPKSALTSSNEYAAELSMTYEQLVNHLLIKYGKAKGDYFLTESCASKNNKIRRTSEELYCHHIDEDKAINLSKTEYARKNPFSYQKADRLVYCNILEHLILHIKIVEAPKSASADSEKIQGIGGILHYIAPQINDFYNSHDLDKQPTSAHKSCIQDNFSDYIKILKYLWNVIKHDKELCNIITKEDLATGYAGDRIDKIYRLL